MAKSARRKQKTPESQYWRGLQAGARLPVGVRKPFMVSAATSA